MLGESSAIFPPLMATSSGPCRLRAGSTTVPPLINKSYSCPVLCPAGRGDRLIGQSGLEATRAAPAARRHFENCRRLGILIPFWRYSGSGENFVDQESIT